MQKNVKIEWDLESTPLEIRSNSVLGTDESDDEVKVAFYSAKEEYAGQVNLYFKSTLQYFLGGCTTFGTNLPVTPPSTADKVWRITLTKTAGVIMIVPRYRVVIHCNEVEVLNILLSDATCSKGQWSTEWSRDVTKIKFLSDDTASDYYGPQPGD